MKAAIGAGMPDLRGSHRPPSKQWSAIRNVEKFLRRDSSNAPALQPGSSEGVPSTTYARQQKSDGDDDGGDGGSSKVRTLLESALSARPPSEVVNVRVHFHTIRILETMHD